LTCLNAGSRRAGSIKAHSEETKMRTLMMIAAAAFCAMAATAATAEPAPPPASPVAADEAPTHEMCKSVMGRKMEARQPHDHGREKTGAMTWPNGKPVTKSEMAKLHKQCAKRMAAAPAK
jgi:hypothetical protein